MIAHISGQVTEKEVDSLVIDVSGIGYQIHVTGREGERVQLKQLVTFFTYHHIREQSQDLFGFSTKDTKELFIQLLSVKNVGPKVALAILDIGSVVTVRQSIAGGDVKLLQTAKGVGKRAAEQIIVELRDKVGALVTDDAEHIVSRSGINQNDEALQALVALGYSESDAHTALHGIDNKIPTEERVKQALKHGH